MAHHIAPPMPEFAEPAQTNLAQQQQQPYPTVKRSENFSSDPNCMEKMYHFMDELGSGGFGKVKLAIHLLTGERVAIKIIDKKAIARDLPRVTSELAALKLLSHQNICRMFQFVETEEKYYIVMEYCNGGEMFDYIIRKERLGESEARHFFRQLVQAVAYIHSMGFAHRDLKPENLLLTQDLQLKVIDFGLCAKPLNGLDRPLDTCCGSPAYAAPELIQNHSYYGNEVDIWSMGVLLYALLCGTLPFDDSNISRLYRRITSGLYVEPPFLTPPCREFLRTLLTVDPKRRATIRQILVHPWVNKNYEQQIKWHTIYSRDIVDEDVARELAYYHCTIPAEMVARIKQWRFDYLTATYLILLQKKERKQNYVLPSFRPNSNKMPCSPTIHASLDMDLDEVTAAGGSYDGEDSNSSDELMASTEKFKTLCCSPSVFAHHSPQQHHQRPKQHPPNPPNCFSPTENGRHQPTPAAEMVQRMTIAMDCATATAADLRTQQQPNIGRYQPPNYQNQNQPIDRPKSVYTTPRRGPLPVPMFVSPAMYRRPNSLERPTPFAADNEPMPMATTPLKQKIPQQQRSNSTDRPASSGDYDNENDHGNGGSGSLSSPPSIPGTPVSTGEGGERRRRMARIDQQQQQLLKTPRSNQRLRQRVFSSLERKADKMINLLTPRKLHKELPTKLKCIKTMVNVSVTSSSDPVQVRNELWKVLLAQGMETTQNGWKVSGSRKDTGVGLATTVELEVVAIEGLPYVGVKRKRIQGDAFTYKRICEEVLRLAGL